MNNYGELEEEDDFERAIAQSGGRLSELALAALAEHRVGETQALDPNRL